MTYNTTFSVTSFKSTFTVNRKYPQYLAGMQMTRQMMVELVLAEFPDSTVSIINVATHD